MTTQTQYPSLVPTADSVALARRCISLPVRRRLSLRFVSGDGKRNTTARLVSSPDSLAESSITGLRLATGLFRGERATVSCARDTAWEKEDQADPDEGLRRLPHLSCPGQRPKVFRLSLGNWPSAQSKAGPFFRTQPLTSP